MIENTFKNNMDFDIKSTALLVVDLEEKFCDPTIKNNYKNNDLIASRIADIAPLFRDIDIQVYAIHDVTNKQSTPENVKFHKFKPVFEKDIIHPKNTHSAFKSYAFKLDESGNHTKVENLKTILENNGHSELLVCGVNLGQCVKKTVLDGIKDGFNVTVLSDLVSSSGHDPGTGYWYREFMEMKNEKANMCDSKTMLEKLKKQTSKLKHVI